MYCFVLGKKCGRGWDEMGWYSIAEDLRTMVGCFAGGKVRMGVVLSLSPFSRMRACTMYVWVYGFPTRERERSYSSPPPPEVYHQCGTRKCPESRRK